MNSTTSKSFLMRALRCVLFAVATLATLVALFYAIENWRGSRAWEKYKAELTARGERLKLSDYAMAPVPPDQNFAETPVLRAIAYKGRVDTNVWAKFQSVHGVQRFYVTGTDQVNRENAEEILAAYKAIEPELAELRAAARRPYAQFTNNNANAFLTDVPNFVALRTLSQLLIIHSFAELAAGHSDRALVDIQTTQRLADSLGGNATLVTAMIRVAIVGLTLQPFEKGLSIGAWSDDQLMAFQKYFESVNLLADVDAALRGGERNGVMSLVEDLPRPQLAETIAGGDSKDWKDRVFKLVVRWCPRGWLYQNAVSYSRVMQMSFATYDVRAQRVFPDKIADMMHALDGELQTPSPFKFLAATAIPNISKATQSTAQNQTFVCEASVACALERYRHARGGYPKDLPELVPQFIASLPADLMTGQTLKYRAADASAFHLYSVGWNLKDEGGARNRDRTEGDWVWPSTR